MHPETDCLGVEYLSAVLKQAGHQTELVFDPMLFMDSVIRAGWLHRVIGFKKILLKEIKELNPDLVCFSVISDNYSWACRIAREIKKHTKVPIVFGGIHPTSVPGRVIRKDFVDFVVVGEGEHALLELTDALESGRSTRRIANVWSKKGRKIYRNPVRPLIQDLDSLPFPDKSIFSEIVPRFFDRYTTITSRGCPFSCTYCNNSYMKKLYMGKGKYLRRRSVGNVIEELRLAKRAGFREIIFHDETFNHDHAWLREFSERYGKEIGLPFFCWIYPANVREDTASMLRKAGCVAIEMGVQTHNKELGRNILNRRCSTKDTRKAIRLFKKESIHITTDNMVGLPLQKSDDVLEMARFYSENGVEFVQTYWLRYFPKTEIVKIARQMGLLDDEMMNRIEESENTSFFTHKGDTFNRELAKSVNSLYVLNMVPGRLSSFLIRHNIHRFLPPKPLYTFMLVVRKPRDFLSRKRRINFSGRKKMCLPRLYIYFTLKRIFNRRSLGD